MRRAIAFAGLVLAVAGLLHLWKGGSSTPASLAPRGSGAPGNREGSSSPSWLDPVAPLSRAPLEAAPEGRARGELRFASAAASIQTPKLSMRFDRDTTPAAFLRVLFLGEEGSPLSGELALEIEGLPRRVVELRGRGELERQLELCVPASTSVRLTADFAGLRVDPVDARTCDAGEWCEARMPLSLAPGAARLELQLVSERELAGLRFQVLLHRGGDDAFEHSLRTPEVEGDRLRIGALPSGSIFLIGQELSQAQAGQPGGLAFSVRTHLEPGERALVRTPVEPGGSVRLRVGPVGSTSSAAPLETELLLPGGLSFRPRWRSDTGSSHRLTPGVPALLVPSLPPGAATLLLHREGTSPSREPLWIRPGEVVDLLLDG